MANVFLNTGAWSDAAVLTTGNELLGSPVTNLQTDQPTQTWQSSGLSNLWVVGNLSPTTAWRGVALLYTNASSSATWRIRAATSQSNLTASPAFDSGTLTFWASPNLETWTRRHSFFLHTTTISQPWLRIDVTDSSNTDGFFRAGRLLVSEGWQPSFNMQYGLQFGVLDESIHQLTLGQQLIIRPVAKRLTANFELAFIPEAEAMASMFEFDRLYGRGAPVLVTLDPADTSHRHKKMIYGTIVTNDLLTLSHFNRYRHRYTIEEMP